ncbi:MAG: DUF6266 family protein [Segetibacter sp.]
MARTQNTLIGRSSGSIGGVTFSTWKGINVAKSKATSVADPKTPAQLAQRARMANAVILAKALGELINSGFVEGATGKSAYNVFVSQNIKNGSISGDPANRITAPATFSLSSGTLDNTILNGMVADASSNEIAITWDFAISGNKLGTDKAAAVVMDASGNVIAKQLNVRLREFGGIIMVATRPMVVGETVHGYLTFYQAGSRKSDDSAYRTAVVQA